MTKIQFGRLFKRADKAKYELLCSLRNLRGQKLNF